MGFNAVKMKVGLGIKFDIKNIITVRKAIGENTCLMVDANHAYSLREAKQLIVMMENLNIYWFEEPILNEDYEGYAELRKLSKIPIVGGECEYLKFGALEMLSKRCVDIFQPDTGACGGITEVKNMMTLAKAFHTNLTPHTWGTGIAIAANLQLMSNLDTVPHRMILPEPMMELDCSPNRLRDEILVENFRFVDGYMIVPEKPGLGININEENVKKFLINSI
jgi:D-galactarolactone cycloisomerase